VKEEMDYITIIGLATAALGGISLFPQLLKVLKTKSTKDISLGMIIIFSSSIFVARLWNFDEKFAYYNRQFFLVLSKLLLSYYLK
jgi:uncharacterized protein with PQ loop repeat